MDLFQKRFLFGVGIVVLFAVAVHFTFQPSECGSFDCFQAQMSECNRASYVHDVDRVSWRYEILGSESNNCKVEVTLLSAKEGEIDLREYEGDKMTCSFEFGVVSYPERNLNRCTGLLKENLQTNIIQRMHVYILSNLGEIEEGLLRV